MQKRVHAVVLNYNQQAATLQAVTELQCSRDIEVDVLVVDCASVAEDRAQLQRGVSVDRLLLLPENRGYAGGMNAGVEFWLAQTPDVPVLLVTPDARVSADVAAALWHTLTADARVGAVGPVVIYREQPRRIGAGGAIDEQGRIRLLTEVQSPAPYDTDWLEGCCILLRPAAFRSVHGFDEQYFLYYEEIDLCQRMIKAGWQIRVTPSVFVLHPKAPGFAAAHTYYYMARNGYRFRAQHFGVSTARASLTLLRSGALMTALALASVLVPTRWPQARERWRDAIRHWRGAWSGTRDHLKGQYGARTAATQRPG